MGLTLCYKTTIFYIYICSFSTTFILQMHIIAQAQAYLRCCKNERKPYWNITSGFNLAIVVINTSFADAYFSHSTGKLHQN